MSIEARLYGLNELNRQMEELLTELKAAGNFGHAGRPGQIGGSAPGQERVSVSKPQAGLSAPSGWTGTGEADLKPVPSDRSAFAHDVEHPIQAQSMNESMRFVLHKGKVFWKPGIAYSMVHEDVGAHYGVSNVIGHDSVRAFFYSPGGIKDGNPENYRTIFSEDQIPSWLDVNKLDEAVRKEMPQWRKETLARMRTDEKTAGNFHHAGRPGMVGGSAPGVSEQSLKITRLYASSGKLDSIKKLISQFYGGSEITLVSVNDKEWGVSNSKGLIQGVAVQAVKGRFLFGRVQK